MLKEALADVGLLRGVKRSIKFSFLGLILKGFLSVSAASASMLCCCLFVFKLVVFLMFSFGSLRFRSRSPVTDVLMSSCNCELQNDGGR